MDLFTSPEAGLFGLFLASFLAATLLPGGSEVALVALLLAHPEQAATALLLATLGNTLGGMTTYGLGRLIPLSIGVTEGNPRGTGEMAPSTVQFTRRHADTLRRWGPAVLLLSWAPLAGDALCAAAGWLRLPLLPCALWMAAGKGARYAFLAWLTL
ncbi:MAG: YqaA family protein [Rhodocyclaceae bacterium]|jgi:membrane protein YqaA with SNARE-associated domain|nr:YqaA family protein [Rhodocyclaceae bacterium]MDO9602505.1 YqaA family protein [Rhodocyclaceae bacterium]MDP2195454.1 YqaA family protein [Rhodocyclaceae bacterium]